MKFELHRGFSESLDEEWTRLLNQAAVHVPFLHPGYLRGWWQTRGGGEWPPEAQLALVTARREGELVGVAPLFWTPRAEGGAALMLLGSVEISDYLDVIVRPQDLTEFVRGLLAALPGLDLPAWSALDLYNLLDDSPSLALLEAEAAAAGYTAQVERLQHSPFIRLPGDWETYLAGIDKKQRHEIRRKMRRLEEAGVPFRWYTADDPDRLAAEVDDFMALMAQDVDKAGFLTPAMRQHLHHTARWALEAGCLHLSFLEIEGHKAAGYFSFDDLNRLWVYNSGMDPAYNAYSPGWVMLGYLLQWANEQWRDVFDFMRGDEGYKYKFGAVDRFVMRVRLER